MLLWTVTMKQCFEDCQSSWNTLSWLGIVQRSLNCLIFGVPVRWCSPNNRHVVGSLKIVCICFAIVPFQDCMMQSWNPEYAYHFRDCITETLYLKIKQVAYTNWGLYELHARADTVLAKEVKLSQSNTKTTALPSPCSGLLWPLLTLDTLARCISLVFEALLAVEIEQILDSCYSLDSRSISLLIRVAYTCSKATAADCHPVTYSITMVIGCMLVSVCSSKCSMCQE